MEVLDSRFYWWLVKAKKNSAKKNSIVSKDLASADYKNTLLKQFSFDITKSASLLFKDNIFDNEYFLIDYKNLHSIFKDESPQNYHFINIPLSVLPGEISKFNDQVISSNSITRQYGTLTAEKKLSSNNSQTSFKLKSSYNIPSCSDLEKLFYTDPLPNTKTKTRKFVDFNEFPPITSNTNILIARIPDDVQELPDSVTTYFKNVNSIWAAGMTTFNKLISLGIPVNGSLDSLGQRDLEHPLIKLLFGDKWLKFTYQKNSNILKENAGVFGWYKLEDHPQQNHTLNTQEINNKTHFYWNSIIEYQTISNQYPQIKSQFHSSGLGQTFDFFSDYSLSQIKKENYQPFYSINDWKSNILK